MSLLALTGWWERTGECVNVKEIVGHLVSILMNIMLGLALSGLGVRVAKVGVLWK